MISEILLLIEQIRPRTTQIYNLGTAIPILFQSSTLETIECVTNSFASANNTFVLVVAEGAFIAYAHKCGGTHIGIAHGAFAVALIAESTYRYTRLFAAHDQIATWLSVYSLSFRQD